MADDTYRKYYGGGDNMPSTEVMTARLKQLALEVMAAPDEEVFNVLPRGYDPFEHDMQAVGESERLNAATVTYFDAGDLFSMGSRCADEAQTVLDSMLAEAEAEVERVKGVLDYGRKKD